MDLPKAGSSNLSGCDEEFAWRVLERIVAGEGSPADEAMLAAWIGSDPGRQRIVDRLRVQWGSVPESHDVDAGWRRMTRHLQPAASQPEVDAAGPRRDVRPLIVMPGARRSPFRVAAVGAVAAALAILAFWIGRVPGSASRLDSPRVYATAVGQRADVRLPDGTHMLVAPESRVRVAADFGVQQRDVYVEGEAYFEVVHDSTRPFTVFAANASTRDVGTAFTVRSYPEERAVRVVVTQGKVVMSGAGPLTAGDVGRLTAEGKASIRHGGDIRALTGWTRGELVFADAPLGQVLGDLHRWYGVEARTADSALASLPFTGSLHDVSPVQGIELVAATLGLQLTRDGTRLVLSRPSGKTLHRRS